MVFVHNGDSDQPGCLISQNHIGLMGRFRSKRLEESIVKTQHVKHPKNQTKRFYQRVMHPKDADSIANSKDPDQTAPLGAV